MKRYTNLRLLLLLFLHLPRTSTTSQWNRRALVLTIERRQRIGSGDRTAAGRRFQFLGRERFRDEYRIHYKALYKCPDYFTLLYRVQQNCAGQWESESRAPDTTQRD